MKAILLLPLLLAVPGFSTRAALIESDVCIFGGTSAGIVAAIQSAQMGRSVVVVEPGKNLGGLTTGGLGATDIGNKAAVGGLSREFYQRVARHYARDEAWNLERRADYFARRGSGQSAASNLDAADATMWTFEPKVARAIYAAWLKEYPIRIVLGQPLAGVRKAGARLMEITTVSGDVFRARIFLDCTYEGDLMAKAGVSYHVGRESNATYGETLNGVRAQTPHHQFTVAVDPYVRPGDPASGLLPFIQSGEAGRPGDGDRKVQAYNYRLCFTTNAANRGPVTPPADYNPARYELLGRYLEALVAAGRKPTLGQFWHPIWMPNYKTDINNNGGFSTDFIGANFSYPEADDATRERLAKEHENYTRGFLTFLATSPRVPENIREETKRWGPCLDEFPETGGWPNQLYVREARRLVSDYVMTEKNCRYQETATDSVGLAAYNMDSHNCQRIVKNGRVENEGDVQVPPMKPYPISYRSLIPRQSECENLLVPVCMAASHIAYGSIRMEPVFMILAQSAATAASLALEENLPVQRLDYARLKTRLLADRQVLAWTQPTLPRTPAVPLATGGLILDETEATLGGDWVRSSSLPPRVGDAYLHDNNEQKGQRSLTFTPAIAAEGDYEILLISTPSSNRATNVPVTVRTSDSTRSIILNQRTGNGVGRLGRFPLKAGHHTTITIGNGNTDGFVVVDGLQLLPVK